MAPRQLDFNDQDNSKPTETYDLTYLYSTLNLGYNYEANHQLKIGGGVDFIFDGTNGQQELAATGIPTKEGVDFSDKTGLSVYVGIEMIVDRISFMVNGTYMVAQTRFESSTPKFEQRIGFKYHFLQNVFAGINLRSYKFQTAKSFEFNMGVRKYIKSGS